MDSRPQTQPEEPDHTAPVPPPMEQGPDPRVEGDVREPVRRLRRKLQRLRAFQELAALAAGVLIVLFVAGGVDFLLRFPMVIRVLLFVSGAAVVGWLIMRRVWPAVTFRPSLTSVALRLESATPSVRGKLASAVDFAASDVALDESVEGALARRVVSRADMELAHVNVARVIKTDQTWRRARHLVFAVAVVVATIWMSPGLSWTGAQRLLMPWSDAEWPKRTEVVDLLTVDVHPRGEALAMRAMLTRSVRGPERTEVVVQYRPIVGGGARAIRREILALQGTAIQTIDSDGVEHSGRIFERLIEPEGEAIEYRFVTADDATDWERIRFVDAPALDSVRATITPPAYAAQLAGALSAAPEPIDLGSGDDDRALAPAALRGATIAATLVLNKPALLPDLENQLRAHDPDAVVERSDQGDQYTARFTLTDNLRLRLQAIDEHEIRSPEPAVYIFTASPDREPAATVIEPTSDIEVLQTARVEVTGEARDDVALAFVAIEQQVFVPAGEAPSGPGGALEARDEATEIVRTEARGVRTAQAVQTLDLSVMELVPGDEVRVAALASDVLLATKGAPPVRSAERVIRIISEQALVDSIRGELAELRQASIRVEGQQAELEAKGEAGALLNQSRRGQGQVSDRLNRQRARTGAIQERVDQNRLNDAGLEALLDGVSEALEQAANASTAAERLLEGAQAAATAEGRNPEVATPEEAAAVRERQEQVREALARVAEMLDRGEDAWVIQNTLNRLLRDQQALRDATAQAGAASAGQRPEDLSEAERREMERLAEEQRQLAERTEDAVRELRDRAAQLRQSDPAASAGLQQAAASAQEQQVAQQMREAAGATEQNQAARAGQAQDEAIEALEEVLEQLEAGERERQQVLRRLLASTIESIEQLIRQQEDELAALDRAEGDQAALVGLDRGMIRLNQNTLGVVDVLRTGGQELAPVLSVVSRAGDAQTVAIRALRNVDVNVTDAREAEQQSLDLLRNAAERAREIEEQLAQQEQDRKEQELKSAYGAMLRKVTALAETTAEFALADRLTRRDRAQLRELAGEHDAMVEELDDLKTTITELSQAAVFSHAHDRARGLAERGADALRESDPTRALISQRAMAQLLRNLIDALADPLPEDDPFSEGPQGGGSGNGSGGAQELLPPAKELRLLRFMQIDLAMRTAEADALQGEARVEAVDEVAQEQGQLSSLGQGVIERLQGGGGGGQLPMPGGVPQPGGGEGNEADGAAAPENTEGVGA